jgi:beta-lactamase class A
VGFGAERFLARSFVLDTVLEKSYQVRQNGSYQYINPLLECEVAEGSINARKENFQGEMEVFLEKQKVSHDLTESAIYFRDLNNGPSFSINANVDFFPASLLKVPVAMAYYRWSEEKYDLLATELLYEQPQAFDYTPTIIPREELVPGQTYTVDELIRRMIVYSDNQALFMLTSRLPIEKITNLFAILGVGEDVLINPEAKLTAREYSSFFRILFNSSYLSPENSEKALALLTTTEYNDALPAGVPSGIKVAHKFGEAGTMDAERQLHDCGIVYFEKNPYLACIMTRGQDPEKLKQSIKEISQFIYQKVDEQN